MSEVVRLAAEMQHREETRGMEKSATVAAAEEVGISEEYLEKAAQELQIRRIAKAQAKRRRNEAMIGAAVAVAGVVGLGFLLKPPAPIILNTTVVRERFSPGTKMQVNSATPTSVSLTVSQWGLDQNGKHYANAVIPQTSLRGYHNVSFQVQGSGLEYMRIDFENGNERWQSPNIKITPGEQPQTLDFRLFEYQKMNKDGKWTTPKFKTPRTIQNVTIKTGDTINDPDVAGNIATGTVTVRDITFK